jgi:hypothetical protein
MKARVAAERPSITPLRRKAWVKNAMFISGLIQFFSISILAETGRKPNWGRTAKAC